MSEAQRLARQYEEAGLYNSNLNSDLKIMKQRHKYEKEEQNHKNRDMEEDCLFREYDWDDAYRESAYCEDKDYIHNLRAQLRKDCQCPKHRKFPS